MTESRLSFVIPARNEEALIGEVVEAILASVAQASGVSRHDLWLPDTSFEVVVADDGSEDATAAIAELGFSKRHVFHSIRGTVITMLERAEVPESTVQDIVGHERSTLTGRTYSGKSTLEMRRAALAKLAY